MFLRAQSCRCRETSIPGVTRGASQMLSPPASTPRVSLSSSLSISLLHRGGLRSVDWQVFTGGKWRRRCGRGPRLPLPASSSVSRINAGFFIRLIDENRLLEGQGLENKLPVANATPTRVSRINASFTTAFLIFRSYSGQPAESHLGDLELLTHWYAVCAFCA